MRTRLEAPGKPTDRFAKPAPSATELAAVKHALECLFASVPEEDMPPAPTELPPPIAETGPEPTGKASTPQGPAPLATAAPAGPVKAAAAAAAPKAAPGARAAAPAAAPAGAVKGGLQGGAVAAQTTATSGSSSGCGGTSGDAAATRLLEWRDVDIWIKMELLLDLEDGAAAGLQVNDAAVAMWLGQLLLGGMQKHDA